MKPVIADTGPLSSDLTSTSAPPARRLIQAVQSFINLDNVDDYNVEEVNKTAYDKLQLSVDHTLTHFENIIKSNNLTFVGKDQIEAHHNYKYMELRAFSYHAEMIHACSMCILHIIANNIEQYWFDMNIDLIHTYASNLLKKDNIILHLDSEAQIYSNLKIALDNMMTHCKALIKFADKSIIDPNNKVSYYFCELVELKLFAHFNDEVATLAKALGYLFYEKVQEIRQNWPTAILFEEEEISFDNSDVYKRFDTLAILSKSNLLRPQVGKRGERLRNEIKELMEIIRDRPDLAAACLRFLELKQLQASQSEACAPATSGPRTSPAGMPYGLPAPAARRRADQTEEQRKAARERETKKKRTYRAKIAKLGTPTT